MNFELLVSLLIPAVIAILGWFFAYQYNVAQDRANKRQDIRVQYLIEAYRRLESLSNKILSESEAQILESSLADIQLFGTAAQVAEAQRVIDQFTTNRVASFDGLLIDLRADLRRELELGDASDKLKFLRIIAEPTLPNKKR